MAEPERRTANHHQGPGNLPAIPDHELLQRIGEGSYGVVWLARSVTGALRAVKIVRRSDFKDDRPYEREFTGLKHFEPLSRAHEGLVDILQVGRNEEAGFFYHVMELADEAVLQASSSHEPTSADYRPLTLQSRLRTEGRLPARECVRLSAVLADALAFLHQAGLVHRDIKPSNIVFVGGVPKLADVGLVAPSANARTYVGTEGFVPPEGPGTPSADIYSLGKVIYEMAMGKDRLEFPSPPTLLDELPDCGDLCELNEVITKACAPRPVDRYRTAVEMATELKQLEGGASVKRARIRCRRQRRMLAAAATLFAVLLPITGWWFLIGSHPKLRVIHEFLLPGGRPASRAVLGDFDGDGASELISGAEGRLSAVNPDGWLLMEGALSGFRGDHFGPGLLADVNGDGRQEVFAYGRDGTNLFVSVFNQTLVEIKRFVASGSLERRAVGDHPSSTIAPIQFLPASSNQPARLLLSITSGYSLWPRALRCLDYDTQEVLWDYPLASPPWIGRAFGLTHANVPLVLLGTYASDNGARLPDGTSDSRSYLHAIGSDGCCHWVREMGDEFTRCFPQPMTLDGSNFVYALVMRTTDAWHLSGKQKPAFGRVLKLDTAGRLLAQYDADLELCNLLVTDLDGDGVQFLYLGDSHGELHVLDHDLKLRQKVSIAPTTKNWALLRVEAAADLDGDGRQELVLQSMDVQFVSGINQGRSEGETNYRRAYNQCLLIYDSDLRRIVRFPIAQAAKTLDVAAVSVLPPGPDGHRDLVLLAQNARVLRLKR